MLLTSDDALLDHQTVHVTTTAVYIYEGFYIYQGYP